MATSLMSLPTVDVHFSTRRPSIGTASPRPVMTSPTSTLAKANASGISDITSTAASLSISSDPTLPVPPVKPEVVETVEAKLSVIEASKRLAAWTAVDHHIRREHKVIGIGSGSTVPYVVERIIAQGEELNRDRVFLPTGFQSKELIVRANLRLGDVDQYPSIDVTIDGADEVDHELNCIKGGGACHLREKVLAEAAETWIVVADYRKNSEILGTTYKAGVPIEVAPFAYAKLLQNVHRLGSEEAALRMAKGGKAGPVVTDNGNFVIDAPFDAEAFSDPHMLLTHIKLLTGVVEVGLFCKMAKAAYFGNADGSVTIKWDDGRVEQVVPNASAPQSPNGKTPE